MMDEENRRRIDSERSKSERSHPTPDKKSVYYNKNQHIVKTSSKHINYYRFNSDLNSKYNTDTDDE